MDVFELDVKTDIVGAYLSSEQIDLICIVRCQTMNELLSFIENCSQLKGVRQFCTLDLEASKRKVFKAYQDTLTPHQKSEKAIYNKLLYLGFTEEEIGIISKEKDNIEYIVKYVKNRYPNTYQDLFKLSLEVIGLERDQIKSPHLYEEILELSNQLSSSNSLLISSGCSYHVVNPYLEEPEIIHDGKNYTASLKYDFYFAKRDLDFAKKNNMHVRYHSLLVTNSFEKELKGKTKEQIIRIIKSYVDQSIDFIHDYNEYNKLEDGTPVIEGVDLFNELISFNALRHVDKNGSEIVEYVNIWEERYGLTIKDLIEIFKYAYDHKPKGLSFLYNEPFLEEKERRKKVIETLLEIEKYAPGLIDTLGSQMHITLDISNEDIKECYEDLKKLQELGYNIQITEFDMSLGKHQVEKVFRENSKISIRDILVQKKQKMKEISDIINNSGVKLKGISYWSMTDTLDSNLERIKTDLIQEGKEELASSLITVCGGKYSFINKE